MAVIHFINENRKVHVPSGLTLAEGIRQAGYSVETPCCGLGTCGKCRVTAQGALSDPDASEMALANTECGERLSCRAVIVGDVVVEMGGKRSLLKFDHSKLTEAASVDSAIRLASLKNTGCGRIWGVTFKDRLLDVSQVPPQMLGVALDIGTTGVSGCLVNLADGSVLSKTSALNPQTQYGGDVLTRITYCMTHDSGPEIMRQTMVDGLNRMFRELAGCRFDVDDIYHIVASGNTTMQHLLLGVDPSSLAKAPYRPVFLTASDMRAGDIGMQANQNAVLTLIPSASSYVGGDIVAGILASGFEREDAALFIDIGTNGEIAVANAGAVVASSTAAGPAFEGMNIECGCRAQRGAVEKFWIDHHGEMRCETVEHGPPTGICGSGLIDIVGSLVELGIITESGRWSKNMPPAIASRFRDKKLYIADGIYISQKDIRQIQLAKGAIAAGILLLLQAAGLTPEDVKTIYIAGSFGNHITPAHMRTIGLIPKGLGGEIRFLGNTSLEGAYMGLVNQESLREAYRIALAMNVMALSEGAEFQEVFIGQMSF